MRKYPERFLKVTGFDEKKQKFCLFLDLVHEEKFQNLTPDAYMDVRSSVPFTFDERYQNYKNSKSGKISFSIGFPTEDLKKMKELSFDRCPFCNNKITEKFYKYNSFTKRHLIRCPTCDAEVHFRYAQNFESSLLLSDPTTIRKGIKPIKRSKLEKIQSNLIKGGIAVKGAAVEEPLATCPGCKGNFDFDRIMSDKHYECSCGLRIEFKKISRKDNNILLSIVEKVSSNKTFATEHSKTEWLKGITENLKRGFVVPRPSIPHNFDQVMLRFVDRLPNNAERTLFSQTEERLLRFSQTLFQDDKIWYSVARYFATHSNERDREVFDDMEKITGFSQEDELPTIPQFLARTEENRRREEEERRLRVQREQEERRRREEETKERYRGELLSKEEAKKFDPYDIQEFVCTDGPTGKEWVKRVLLEIKELNKLVELHKKTEGTFKIFSAEFDPNNDRVIKIECEMKNKNTSNGALSFLIRLHRNYPKEPPVASDFSNVNLTGHHQISKGGEGWSESHLRGFSSACLGNVYNNWDKNGRMGVAHFLKMLAIYMSSKHYKTNISKYKANKSKGVV